MQGLSQDEIDSCRAAFLTFDKDRSGTIDAWELRQVLEQMGEAPTEDELFQVRSSTDRTFICVCD
jgi:calmodulin